MTVEPVMLMDGACKEAMLIYTENVQMNKICSVKLGYSKEVCGNLSDYDEHNVAVQRELTVFTFYNSIIMSVLPLIYVLFMGAWSDKYGRKIPIIITLVCRFLHAMGYFLVNWQTSWPVEVLYPITFLEAIGGGNAGILSSSISYISDITREKDRTSRVSTANSLWFLGGPMGTLLAAVLIKNGGYNLPLGIVALTYIAAAIYVVVFINESHGPRAKKELQAQGSLQPQDSITKTKISFSTMVKDFFDWHRVLESFKTAFKRRDGNVRAVLLTVLVANMVRRVARGFFMYQFVRQVLDWDASEYGYWITYRNLLAALGSLFLVPLLTRSLSFTDTSLVVLGTGSLILEYLFYGLTGGVSMAFLMWLGPPGGLLSNACVIAFKSMATKLVSSQEKGRINAVIAALNGLMPMVGYAAYSPIYYHSVDTFPAAQFYFGASLNLVIMVTFIAMGVAQVSMSYNAEDLEKGKEGFGPKILHGLKRRSSVTLQAIARTFSVPGGKNIVRIPSQPQPATLKEVVEEKEVSTTPGNQKCFTNPLSDAELMASEVDVKGTSEGHPASPSVVCVLPPSKADSTGPSSMC
ncbi:hypothetical protein O3P69_010445 [Scylla paramamosain]|uniref:Proton-coupled folate transporter n=2 Tax=Scylla paramamosain TaxID=85552 RepID=A0AAW0TUJ7_SCYPA